MKSDDSAAHSINKLSNQLRRKIDASSSAKELSGAQGRVLHFLLAQKEDIFQKDIEEEFSLRAPTATELLKKMERSGLIYREPLASDARRKRIIVSEKALQFQEMVMEDIDALERELTKGISEEDLKTFFKVMDQMMNNLY